jgi:hypothetical protein
MKVACWLIISTIVCASFAGCRNHHEAPIPSGWMETSTVGDAKCEIDKVLEA